MDSRLTPFSGRVALTSLQGQVSARFTEGEPALVTQPLADLLDKPHGARQRQLLLGAAVTLIDQEQGHVFLQARRDGYCGWVREDAVGSGAAPTHWVVAQGSHLYSEPRVQAQETGHLSLGARVAVSDARGAWAHTPQGHVPLCHLRPIGHWAPDPVQVAESLLGTPYLWGGNSRFGIDCSGLVQVALQASGRDCPGDSDMQIHLGRSLAPDEALRRGDLLFWKGHVALVVNADLLVHANGSTMSVAHEGIGAAITRIAQGGGGPVLARQRL